MIKGEIVMKRISIGLVCMFFVIYLSCLSSPQQQIEELGDIDTTPPTLIVPESITVEVDSTISYRNDVEYYDDVDDDLTFKINASNVDVSVAGTYFVIYSVADSSENISVKSIPVFVEEPVLDENTLLALKILDKILTDDMTQYETAKAIFNYVNSNIWYNNSTNYNSLEAAAYAGLTRFGGGCYVYAAASDLLLQTVGIETMLITADPSVRNHYWNLIDIGDGWQHFDTTKRIDDSKIFLWSDSKLMAYSKSNSNSHYYDTELYPDIK